MTSDYCLIIQHKNLENLENDRYYFSTKLVLLCQLLFNKRHSVLEQKTCEVRKERNEREMVDRHRSGGGSDSFFSGAKLETFSNLSRHRAVESKDNRPWRFGDWVSRDLSTSRRKRRKKEEMRWLLEENRRKTPTCE